MKFNPLSIVKKKYSFEFLDDNNVETPEKIKDAMDLICWAEEENARHLEEDTSGSVVIIKQNKKGVVLYGQRIEFPMDLETDFDSLMESFYTRKVIPFDQTLLSSSNQKETAFVAPPTPPVPPLKDMEQNDSEVGYAAVPTIRSTEESVEEEKEQVTYQPSDIQELIALQKEQQEEIRRLRQQLEEKEAKNSTSEPVSPTVSGLVIESVVEGKENAVQLGVPGEGKAVYGSAAPSNLTFQERMDLFMLDEKKKIEAEIEAADNRSIIESSITAKLQAEKDAAVSKMEFDLFDQQTKAIEQEEKRHALEMERIRKDYDNQISAKALLLDEKYKNKAEEEIRTEYNKQTEALKKIYDKRMAELKERQKELSAKMMENIESSFSSLDLNIDEPKEQKKEKEEIPDITDFQRIRVGE
ncbi:hypothetical protein ABE871_17265 [Enterococcus gilvus]|uniref:hypothetical protein n=1 Tax=Enterococcus gilvus TaxID=160453 RepID=UPI003D6AF92B